MKITNQSTLNSKITLPDMSEEEVETKSNESVIENMSQSFKKEKTANKMYAMPGDEIELTLTLTNNSEYPISDVQITDTLPADLTFKASSVAINNMQYEAFNPTTGFVLPDPILASQSSVIKYTVTLSPDATTQKLETKSKITYSVNNVQNLEEDSNTLEINIAKNEITLNKTASKSAVVSGETISYTIEVKNQGTVKNTNLKFVDTLPDGITFVPGTVTINGATQADADPNTGFSLQDMEPNDELTIKFDVLVD